MQFRHVQYEHKRNQEGWGLQPPLAKSLKNVNQKYKRLNLFWVEPESKRGWAILKFAMRKSSSITNHAVVHLLQSTIGSSSFYFVECIHHTLAILLTSYNFWLMFANQLWADHFGTWLIAKLFYSVQKKLRTSNISKLWTSRIKKLRTSRIRKLWTRGCGFKNPETSLRTKLLKRAIAD